MNHYICGMLNAIHNTSMSYISARFYILVAFSVVLYYMLPRKIRWIMLLISSGYFYYAVSNKKQLVICAIAIYVSYLAGIFIKKAREKGKYGIQLKMILGTGILISTFPLIISKCGDFLLGSVMHKPQLSWIIPVGLSFYSMQMIAYLVDIYRGKIEPQRNVLKYTLFISFFPVIIQGPISRYDQLSDQLFEGHAYDSQRVMRGIQLIIWALFLKYLIADKASVVVDTIFDSYGSYAGFYIWTATVLYSIQLYTDFLSCVTISQGVAGLFGINLIDNFCHPYFSTSIKEFWRRWHISLSEWLRDYVYIPLGGNRRGKIRKYMNLAITFAISGLWHGGRWNYVFWGLMHAGYQIAGELLCKPRDYILEKISLPENSRTRRIIEMIVTSFLVMLTWIIFRAESLKSGIRMMKSMFDTFNPWILFDDSLFRLGLNQKEFEVLFMAILFLIVISIIQERGGSVRGWFNRQNIAIRWIIYFCAIWSIWIFGTYGYGFNAADFIYGGF